MEEADVGLGSRGTLACHGAHGASEALTEAWHLSQGPAWISPKYWDPPRMDNPRGILFLSNHQFVLAPPKKREGNRAEEGGQQ